MFLRMLLSASLFISAFSYAQNPAQSNLPIHLQADEGDYNAETNTATYKGNVTITQGEMNLKGDKVVVKFANGEVITIEAWGKLARFHYVPKDEPPIDGEGEYMKYTVASKTIDIDKQAFVKQEDRETKADHLTYNLEKERLKGKRVYMTLVPKS